MSQLELFALAFNIIQVFFAFAFGSCVGSLVNVLVYRLPLGISVVTPPSRCPSCSTQLTWRENIPVFGWIFLKGKCRFCGSKISAEYPLVEAFVGLLFVTLYVLFYMLPMNAKLAGIHFGAVQPDWALNGFGATWAPFIVILTLMSCLVAMTLVDAKTYTIPLVLAWVPCIVALVLHPGWALFMQLTGKKWHYIAGDHMWSMATPGARGWWWIGASIGGIIGLAIANFILEKGWIARSFADYDEWEKSTKTEKAAKEAELAAAAAAAPPAEGTPPAAPASEGEPTEMWIQYPHARREMGKEIVFLTPCVVLAYAGGMLARSLAGPAQAPLWLVVLAAVLMGYLIAGGLVWGFRILGSIGFGKEAIGLGDVHLLAAVGACLGWADAVIAFFLSAFVGVFLAILRRVASGAFKRAMPFGPCLAIATLLVILFKPLLETGLSRMFQTPINLP